MICPIRSGSRWGWEMRFRLRRQFHCSCRVIVRNQSSFIHSMCNRSPCLRNAFIFIKNRFLTSRISSHFSINSPKKRNSFQLNAALDVMTREHFGSREFVVRFVAVVVVVVIRKVKAHPARRRSRAAPCQKFVSEAGTGGPLHALVHLKHQQRSCTEWRKYLAPSITRPSYWRSTLISLIA